jgi:hypothetical protein
MRKRGRGEHDREKKRFRIKGQTGWITWHHLGERFGEEIPTTVEHAEKLWTRFLGEFRQESTAKAISSHRNKNVHDVLIAVHDISERLGYDTEIVRNVLGIFLGKDLAAAAIADPLPVNPPVRSVENYFQHLQGPSPNP